MCRGLSGLRFLVFSLALAGMGVVLIVTCHRCCSLGLTEWESSLWHAELTWASAGSSKVVPLWFLLPPSFHILFPWWVLVEAGH